MNLRPGTVRSVRAVSMPVLLAGAHLLAGCGGSDASPDAGRRVHGNDATFNFAWRIDGEDPTSATDPCTRGGVQYIRMVVVDDAMPTAEIDSFQFDCRLGTHASSAPELAAGTYRLFWEAVARDGHRVSLAASTLDMAGSPQPMLEQHTFVRGGHTDFDASNRPDSLHTGQPTNFSTGSVPLDIRLRFMASAADTVGADCATAGVTRLVWTLRYSNAFPAAMSAGNAAVCPPDSTLHWDRREFDNYTLDVAGDDGSGRLAWQGSCRSLLVGRDTSSPIVCRLLPVGGGG